MASRYWVGGTGTWDASNTTNWSASSGGAGGASVPTAADAVLFDAASGGGTCTIGATVPCLTLNLSGYTGTLAFGTNKIEIAGNAATIFTQTTSCNVSGTPLIDLTYTGSTGTRVISALSLAAANTISFNVLGGTDIFSMVNTSRVRKLNFTGFSGSLAATSRVVYGDLTLSPTMTITAGAGGTSLRAVTSGDTNTLTTNGVAINNFLRQDTSGTWRLGDNLTFGATYGLIHEGGTFDANGHNISTTYVTSSNSSTRVLSLGTGTWTVSGSGTAWDCTTSTNLTVSASTGVIDMTSASAKTFAGGGKAWPTLNQGGTGALTITGANTFANLTNTVQPATITFPASTTTTVSAFGVSGTSGNLITLNSSTSGTRATLSDASGVNSVSFCDIKDINATGGAIWNALTSNGNIDGGNNLNWNFSATPQTVSEVTYTLRSFTTPRRF